MHKKNVRLRSPPRGDPEHHLEPVLTTGSRSHQPKQTPEGSSIREAGSPPPKMSLSGLVPGILTRRLALRTQEVDQVEGERLILDHRSALRLLTSSALFLPVRKKRSLVNRGSSRDPEIKSQNRAQIERRRALFPGSQSTSSGMQSGYVRSTFALYFKLRKGFGSGSFLDRCEEQRFFVCAVRERAKWCLFCQGYGISNRRNYLCAKALACVSRADPDTTDSACPASLSHDYLAIRRLSAHSESRRIRPGLP